jgi:cytochrome c biogenesis protein CcmG, thiol:disulfide interchange protein DsbE
MNATSAAAKPAGRALGGRLTTVAVIIVTAVVIGLVAYVIDQPASASGVTKVTLNDTSATPPQAGQVPPDFQGTTIDGKTVSLSQLKGQPVWLTFGASWCGDCRAEAPDLEATYAKFKGQGLVVLQVSIQEDAAAVQEYAKRVGFTFTMVPDPDTRIADAYHILGIPTHYFIGRDGVIREVRLGGLKPAEMERLVGEIVG